MCWLPTYCATVPHPPPPRTVSWQRADEGFSTLVLFQSNNVLSTDDHLFSNGGTCYEPPMLGLETRHTYIHLWNNTQLKHKPLTFCFVFFRPLKLLPLLSFHPCFFSTCLPPVHLTPVVLLYGVNLRNRSIHLYYNWFQSTHSRTISAAASQLDDKSQQSKISRVNYSWCANMINDMLEPVTINCGVVSIPRAAKRLFRWRIRRKARLSAQTGQLGTTRQSGIRREVHPE